MDKLSETVRHYVRAFIIKNGILPFKYPKGKKKKSDGKVVKDIQFGVTSSEEVHQQALAASRLKRKLARLLAKAKAAPPRKKSSPVTFGPGETFTASELATLAEQAKQALAQAEELAGERVKYCCGSIRLERYKCIYKCSSKKQYRAVNELQ